MMDEGRHENEVRTDVKLLLDCLKCQVNNPTAVKQALLTLSSIFSACDFIKEYFKDIGGLTFIIDLLTSIENPEVQERAFFCLGCAIERNVFCQKSVTSSTVFKFIQTILSRGSTAKLKQTATFFLINLVANNGEGQVLVKQSQCLSTLMDLLCKALPKDMRAEGRDETGFDWFDDSGPTSIELWTSVVNALCVSINNPQNEENQKACGLQVPFIFKLLKQNRGIPSLTRPLMFLLGFIVSNNRSNQDQVRRCGGLDVLCLELQDQYYHSNDPELLKDVIQIITTIDSCIADNEESAKELGQAGVIQILAGVIHNEKLGIGERIKVTITLGHAIEHSVSNRSLFLEAKNGLQDLIHILTTCENEELTKAIKYVLQVTVQKDTNSDEEEWNQEITNKKSIGENILKKVNELANHLKSIEKEKELGGHLPTIIHTAQYNKNFDECPSTQDFVYTQPTLTFQNPNLLYLGNSVCKDANNNSSAFQISDDWKQQLSLTPFEKHLISELQKERLKNSDQTIRNHIACEPDKQKLVFERKEQVHEACTCTALEAEPGTHNYHNDDTEHRNSGCTSKIHVSNTRSLSSNSSTKSYDVDLTKMTDGKETKCTTVDGKIPLSEGIFKVPTCPPPKTQARCFRQVQSEPLCFPEAQGDTSFVESDAGFSDIQSEFDCKLLSGAADHKDGRMNPQATPVRQISVFPVERSNQQAYKTPEYQYSQRNTSNCSRNFLTTPTCSVKSVRSTLSSLKQDKTSGTDCSRQILHSKNSRLKMSCIGCTGTDCSDDTLLNSRTLNIVLETNPYTCQVHRQVRNIERSYIQKVKQQQRERPIYSYNKQDHPTNEKPSYDFSSESEAEVSAPDTIESRNSIVQTLKPVRKRRHRVPYSAEEVNNLLEGVDKIGKFWGQILATYKFHPSRTAVDLMEKFKRVSKSKEFSKNKGSLRKLPFSMCEERRLLKGVKQFGYSWKTILQYYKFASFRTTEDLRNKWRTLNA